MKFLHFALYFFHCNHIKVRYKVGVLEYFIFYEKKKLLHSKNNSMQSFVTSSKYLQISR